MHYYFLWQKRLLLMIIIAISCHFTLGMVVTAKSAEISQNLWNGCYFEQRISEVENLPKFQHSISWSIKHCSETFQLGYIKHLHFFSSKKNALPKEFSPPLILSLWTVQSAKPLRRISLGTALKFFPLLSPWIIDAFWNCTYITLSRFICTVANEGVECVFSTDGLMGPAVFLNSQCHVMTLRYAAYAELRFLLQVKFINKPAIY